MSERVRASGLRHLIAAEVQIKEVDISLLVIYKLNKLLSAV
jgi:hypothetical protein